MTQEEKARKYDEALERAKYCLTTDMDDSGHWAVKHIFPELKESEDEKIRKWLEELIEAKPDNSIEFKDVKRIDVLHWLEKQGDKPQFKVGDWIVFNEQHNSIYQVERIDNYRYYLRHYLGGTLSVHFDTELIRQWTIADTKEGDVLAFDDETIVIFKNLYNSSTFHSYCHIEDGVFNISKDDMPDWWEGKGFHPATKEQRDLLFQKMKEAGYEWDAENKELKKIEEKPTYKVKPKFKAGDYIKHNKANIICHVISVNTGYYYVENIETGGRIELFNAEQNFHLWTIQDAKNGDVLAEDSCIFIIQKLGDNSTTAKTYCTLYDDGDFDDGTILYFDIDSTKPATKEQCEQLFKEMHKAGYEWDANNLKLWHIEKENMEDEKETTSEYKFKEGDWIIYEDEGLREILKVTAPPDNEYICENLNGENRYLYNKDADDYTFWNINYVKPGDILVWNDSNDLTCIALIKNITYDYLKNEGKVDLWFSYFTDGYWEAWNGGTPYTNVTSLIACDAKPANKRERDLLFQKMKESGYEWDVENKKLIDKVNYASIINNFKKLMKESKPIPPEVQKVINENFWEML